MREITRHSDGTCTWKCNTGKCDATVSRFRGQSDVQCFNCGQWFSASANRLRNDWMNNPSNYDENIGDLEGYEIAHAGDQ